MNPIAKARGLPLAAANPGLHHRDLTGGPEEPPTFGCMTSSHLGIAQPLADSDRGGHTLLAEIGPFEQVVTVRSGNKEQVERSTRVRDHVGRIPTRTNLDHPEIYLPDRCGRIAQSRCTVKGVGVLALHPFHRNPVRGDDQVHVATVIPDRQEDVVPLSAEVANCSAHGNRAFVASVHGHIFIPALDISPTAPPQQFPAVRGLKQLLLPTQTFLPGAGHSAPEPLNVLLERCGAETGAPVRECLCPPPRASKGDSR
jgi:hypothetical protein